VEAHNQRRLIYHNEFSTDSFVPVQWDENLAADAQAWADFLISKYTSMGSSDADTCFANFAALGSDENRYGGENLFASVGDPKKEDNVLGSWPANKRRYKLTKHLLKVSGERRN
jgi:hypothetical protein